MADSPPYMWLTSILTLWLFAAVARQIFDLVGKLWIPVAFNLLQILSCITGLFAVCQHRMCLLLCLTVTSILSTMYNALIILWYSGVFGDFSRPLLSAGLPYSHSFFLIHTPTCEYRFNLTSLRWLQYPCPLPYNHIESLQAIIHIIFAVTSVILSSFIFYERGQKKSCVIDRKRKRPKIAMEFPSNVTLSDRLRKLNAVDSANDIDSGFMNSTYDEGQERDILSGAKIVKPEGGYIRQSARKHRIKSSQLKTQGSSHRSCKSISAFDLSGRSSRNGINRDQLYNFKTDSFDDNWNDYEDPYSRPRARSGSARSFKMSTTQNARRMFSQEHLASGSGFDGRCSFRRSSANNLTSLVSFDPKSSTLIRVHEHVAESSAEEFSSNHAEMMETSLPSDVPASTAPPPPAALASTSKYLEVSSTDSGRPSTDSNAYDWTLSSISCRGLSNHNHNSSENDSRLLESTNSSYPVGYEPALCDPIQQVQRQIAAVPGISLINDPLYRSNNLQASSRKKSSIGHYQDPNTYRLMAYENEPRNPPASLPVMNNNSVLV